MQIVVVRLGHRVSRDIRVTTHVALASRALGAQKVFVCGEPEPGIVEGVRAVSKRWGGGLSIRYEPKWKKLLKRLKKQRYCLVHATMYGEPIQKIAKKLAKKAKIALIVGAEKVPIEVYHQSDYNVSVTNQPHSEVAALAIILHELQRGKELEKRFSHARIRIIPNADGKTVRTPNTRRKKSK